MDSGAREIPLKSTLSVASHRRIDPDGTEALAADAGSDLALADLQYTRGCFPNAYASPLPWIRSSPQRSERPAELQVRHRRPERDPSGLPAAFEAFQARVVRGRTDLILQPPYRLSCGFLSGWDAVPVHAAGQFGNPQHAASAFIYLT